MMMQTTLQAESVTAKAILITLTSQPTDVCVVDVANRAVKYVMADLRSDEQKSGSHHGGIFTASVC